MGVNEPPTILFIIRSDLSPQVSSARTRKMSQRQKPQTRDKITEKSSGQVNNEKPISSQIFTDTVLATAKKNTTCIHSTRWRFY